MILLITTNGLYRTQGKYSHYATKTTSSAPIQSIINKSKSQSQIAQCERAFNQCWKIHRYLRTMYDVRQKVMFSLVYDYVHRGEVRGGRGRGQVQVMACSRCMEGGLGQGMGPAQQETMGQVPVPVSVQCEHLCIIHRNPLLLFLFPLPLPLLIPCSVNEPLEGEVGEEKLQVRVEKGSGQVQTRGEGGQVKWLMN